MARSMRMNAEGSEKRQGAGPLADLRLWVVTWAYALTLALRTEGLRSLLRVPPTSSYSGESSP